MMKHLIYAAMIVAGITAVPAANAADDITMHVVEGDAPEAVTNQIELPDQAAEQARTSSEKGITTANQARDQEQTRERVRETEKENEDALRERRREMHEERRDAEEELRQETEQEKMNQTDSTYQMGQ